MEIIESLTFDDILLVPSSSDILPYQAKTKTHITKNLSLNSPII